MDASHGWTWTDIIINSDVPEWFQDCEMDKKSIILSKVIANCKIGLKHVFISFFSALWVQVDSSSNN